VVFCSLLLILEKSPFLLSVLIELDAQRIGSAAAAELARLFFYHAFQARQCIASSAAPLFASRHWVARVTVLTASQCSEALDAPNERALPFFARCAHLSLFSSLAWKSTQMSLSKDLG
jgi:hypothetical protein